MPAGARRPQPPAGLRLFLNPGLTTWHLPRRPSLPCHKIQSQVQDPCKVGCPHLPQLRVWLYQRRQFLCVFCFPSLGGSQCCLLYFLSPPQCGLSPSDPSLGSNSLPTPENMPSPQHCPHCVALWLDTCEGVEPEEPGPPFQSGTWCQGGRSWGRKELSHCRERPWLQEGAPGHPTLIYVS